MRKLSKAHPKIGACSRLLLNSRYKCKAQILEANKIYIRILRYNENIYDFSLEIISQRIIMTHATKSMISKS